jgi:acylphosphatase
MGCGNILFLGRNYKECPCASSDSVRRLMPIGMFDFHSISSYFHNELEPCMKSCAHIIVSGLVQGVGFRYFAAREATQLGVTGYVRNLHDGNVEIRASGDRSVLEEFVKIVRVGPRAAHVRDLSVDWQPADHHYHGFDIR